MSQQQATLPFNQQAAQNFEHYLGNEAVVETLKQVENLPQFVYLWGGCYSGKTHLLNALQTSISDTDDVCFAVDAACLSEVELIDMLPKDLNYLLLDGVQKLAGAKDAELALFNLFNHCKSRGIKLLVTASIHSKSDAWQLPDLVSRLSSGLSLKLEALQGATALTCIARQFELNGIPLEPSVIQYLQTHHSSDYAELYRLFLQVSAESLKLKRKVTVPLLKQTIQQQTQSNCS